MELLAVLLIGLFAGLLGGLLGIGGSLIMIPALTEYFGPDQHLYQAAAMIVNVFVAIPAVVQHRRAGAVDGGIVRRLIPLTAAFVVLGVLISEAQVFAGRGEAYLRGVFAAFLFLVSAVELVRTYRLWKRAGRPTGDTQPALRRPGLVRLTSIAGPTGIIAGLLGVGGGVLAVPLQRRLLHMPIRHAIANSAALIISTATIGAVLKYYAYATDAAVADPWRPVVLALGLIPTAIVGSLAGSRLTHILSVRAVRIAFLGLMLIVAIRLSKGAIEDVRHPIAVGQIHAAACNSCA